MSATGGTGVTTATALMGNTTLNCADDNTPEFNLDSLQTIISIVVPIFFGLICVLSVIGNSLVIVIVASNASMRSTTNILIINLAVADLLFAVFCIPFTATDYVLPYWIFGDVWCRIVQYLIIVTACASVYTLVLMSLDRYLAVVHPIASMSMRTEGRACIAVGIIWIVILTSSIPVLFIHGEYDEPLSPCDTTSTSQAYCRILPDANWPLFQATFFGASYVVPLTLISVLYFLMLIRLWKGTRTSVGSRRGRKRVTRLVLVVVGVFALCWLPIQVILLLKSMGLYTMISSTVALQILSHILAYMNSCINPILYAFLSENFCKAFRKIIYCRSRKSRQTRLGLTTKSSRAGPSSADIL
ncbi:allatostatin-A receptor-like [Phymastichus coffea]|uniref:allatostatin-A receptor-like n=1 Tax=Phymastichus coffea TaxID=108790 RepID=UPI00273CA05A|nr:allatostatin-A receptor-like [Phymastichus coffea]